MTGKNSPLNVAVIKQKIEKGQVKVKARRNTANKTKSNPGVKGQNGRISDAEILAWLKEQDGHITSTQIRDALGFTSRTQARRVMRRLAKRGVVKISETQLTKKRRIFMFEIA